MSSSVFTRRQRAVEGQWFNTEERLSIVRHLERMVAEGKIDSAALDAVRRNEKRMGINQMEIIREREFPIFEYKRGHMPLKRPSESYALGTQFSLGRSRWMTGDDASVFSLADGKRLAATPPSTTTNYDNIRMAKIQRAALETPTVAGYRVLPEMTPGRAFLWGTVLAIWGTMGAVSLAAKRLDIHSIEDASSKLREAFKPSVASIKEKFEPLRSSMALESGEQNGMQAGAMDSELVRRLKANLMGSPSS